MTNISQRCDIILQPIIGENLFVFMNKNWTCLAHHVSMLFEHFLN